MSCDTLFKRRTACTVLLGTTFVCCGLIIYNNLSHYKTKCTSQESCSNSYPSESARLSSRLGSENCSIACNTENCIQNANSILNRMNRSADPCKDFYAFSCGSYGHQFEKDSCHSMLDLADDMSLIVKDTIETSNETQIDGSAAQKLKIVYDSCINSKSSDLSAIPSMQRFLNQMGIPNWPHLNSNFSFRNPTFEEVVGKLVPYQEDIFLRFVDRRINVRLLLEQGLYNISVKPQYQSHLNDQEVKKLKNVVMGILQYTGMNNKDINRTWEEFMHVEDGLRTLYRENRANEDCDEETTIVTCTDNSQQNASEIMLCKIWDSVVRNGKISIYVNKDLVEISCEHIHYIEKLPSVLSSYNHRTLAHYIALKVLMNNLRHMGFSIRKNLGTLLTQLDSYDEEYSIENDRWKFCVFWVADNMKSPLGLMYVKRMWNKDAIDELEDIVNEYRQTIIQSIQEQEWINNNDTQSLVQWVNGEQNFISSMFELYRNTTKINTSYRKFHPTRDDFFRNVINHKRFLFIGKYNMTKTELDIQAFTAYDVDAYGGTGIIELSFGILLPPLFKYGYPKLFNIARIGAIIGHEFGHGVIKTFRDRRDEFGNATMQHFYEILKCFSNQYFSYELKRIKQNVNGNRTIYENFCDNMSVEVAEKIAEKLIRLLEEENFTLPGLPYSAEELFYISFAQVWCDTRSIEKDYALIDSDTHSPAEYRVIGTLQNSKRFSEVFHCPSTSYMNAEKKCIVFD